ncbi:MAG: PAS domain S-box protein, partial [Candidatus Methylomirabilis sp.]|nr:PAS domain S-box protein [Deltaproteobacteria bacterium]
LLGDVDLHAHEPQRRTEDELRLFRERYLRVLESTRDVFFTLDAQGRFVDANPAFERVTGYEVREWVGRGYRSLVRPRNREDAGRGLRALPAGEPIDGAELCIVSKGGAEVFVDVSATPVVEEGEIVSISCVARDVTERRRAEAVLRENERRLRNMVETLPAGAVYVEGVSLFMNRLAEELTGYRREEIPNIDVWFRALYGERAVEMRKLYEADRRAGFANKRSVEFTRKDGARRWAEFAAYRSDGGEVWLMTDVTESREAEERLRRTQFAVEHAGVEIYRLSAEGEVVDANEQACRALGYAREELVGRSVREIDADYSRDERREQWKAMLRDGSVTFRSRMRGRGGRVRPVEVTANH